jgi:hypothetical protein
LNYIVVVSNFEQECYTDSFPFRDLIRTTRIIVVGQYSSQDSGLPFVTVLYSTTVFTGLLYFFLSFKKVNQKYRESTRTSHARQGQ